MDSFRTLKVSRLELCKQENSRLRAEVRQVEAQGFQRGLELALKLIDEHPNCYQAARDHVAAAVRGAEA